MEGGINPYAPQSFHMKLTVSMGKIYCAAAGVSGDWSGAAVEENAATVRKELTSVFSLEPRDSVNGIACIPIAPLAGTLSPPLTNLFLHC